MQTEAGSKTSSFLISCLLAWTVTQVIKVLVHKRNSGRFDIKRLFGDGGMPSAHSATVCALTMMCALQCGMGSPIFAISAILAIVVCHDAMHVRKEVEKHAAFILELKKTIPGSKELPGNEPKQFVGHSLLQVVVGVLIGCAVSTAVYFFL